MMHVYSIVYTV